MNNAQQTLELVCHYLQGLNFVFTVRNDDTGVDLRILGQHGVLDVSVRIIDGPLLVRIIVQLSLVVPEVRRLAVAETIVRANCGMLVGNFDLDLRTGIVAFRAAVPLADAALTAVQFSATWGTALAMANRYNRAFGRLLFGDDLSPAEVVAEVELAD